MRWLRVLSVSLCLGALAACGSDGGGGAGGDGGSDGGSSLIGQIDRIGPADEGIDGVDAYRVESADHTNGPVAYTVTPPPGGPHFQAWANCGFYDQPVADEHVVHALEHGAVWLAYSPDLPAADVEVIHDLVRLTDKTIATPYPGLAEGEAVVASAWARQLRLDSVADTRLERFVIQYQDGSQAPEAGVTCTGSPVGQPIP